MDPFLLTGLACVAAYLVGGVPFGYLIARARGVDIFQHGSGNIGATNVGRVLGRRFGVLVFGLDFAKGACPAVAALRAAQAARLEAPLTPEAVGVLAGLAAFLGHLFPIYLRFRGGKGVATGAGVVAVLLPGPALGGLVVWLSVVCGTRYVSLASLAAAAALCGLRLALTPAPLTPENAIVTVFCLLVAALVLLRHRANVTRLLHGTENHLRETPAMQLCTRTLHVLALGLWFGTVVFFTFVVGLSLFSTFEGIGQRNPRPEWFPLPGHFEKQDNVVNGPKEQGTRAAGAAVEPLFLWYFLIQGVRGFLAVGTALGISRSHAQTVHRARAVVLLLALVTVVAGWPLERKVGALRGPRYEVVDAYLQSSSQNAEAARDVVLQARAQFGLWHTISLFLNFGTVALVAVGMALAARLPAAETSGQLPEKNGQVPASSVPQGATTSVALHTPGTAAGESGKEPSPP